MNETLSPHGNVMEMNYIYCVPCHNLLLNKRTVLEKAPVMILVAARGQCGPAEATGGPGWRGYHRWMLRDSSHHLSRTILPLAAAHPQIYSPLLWHFHRMDGFGVSGLVRPRNFYLFINFFYKSLTVPAHFSRNDAVTGYSLLIPFLFVVYSAASFT